MTVTMDPATIYAPPTFTELVENEELPDPEGYYIGQEEYGYNSGKSYAEDNDYDDAYEPDFQYDPY